MNFSFLKIPNIFKKEIPKKIITSFKIEKQQQKIIRLPEIEEQENFDFSYPLIEPYAKVRIFYDKEVKEIIYKVEEPELDEKEKQALKILENGIRELINLSFVNIKEERTVIEYLEKNMRILNDELKLNLSEESFSKLMYYIYRDFIGLNEIEPLMNDYFIEDIECNGSSTPIYIIHRKYRNLKTNISFKDNEKLANFVEKLAQKAGKYISYANPLLDGKLPDGSIDYEEPIIYKEDGIVKVEKIGKFVDKYYKNNESNKPAPVKNIEVPAFDGETLKINWKELGYVYRHRINENLFELELEFGKKIRLTGCHSIFSFTKAGIKSERTDKLKIGDYISIPLKIPENNIIKEINIAEEFSKTNYANKLIIDNIPEEIYKVKKQEIIEYLNKNYKTPHQTYYGHKNKRILPLRLYKILDEKDLRKCKIRPTSAVGIPTFININKEFVQLLGLYLAEGWLYSNSFNSYGVYFSLNKKEIDLIETIKKSSKKCFDLNIYTEPEEKNAIKVRINSYVLWILFNDILKVTTGAKKKRIPEIIFNMSKELQQEFLKFWSLGDYGSTASRDLINDISYLSLFNNDIVAFYEREKESLFNNIRKTRSYEYYTNFFVRNCDNPYAKMIPTSMFNPLKETHQGLKNNRINKQRLSSIINEKRYKRFINLKNVNSIKFIKEWSKRGFIKNNKLTEKGKDLIKELNIVNKLTQSDLGFAKIKSIKRVKSSSNFVYDVSVKNHENFIGGHGGICCHNSRVNATYSKDISTRGPTFTIRKFSKEPWTPVKLIEFRTVSPEILAYLWILIEFESNIMVIGGTGSGKTSFLNALAFFIPPKARIVSIEDTKELSLMHENWLPAVAREGVGLANIIGQKHGEVSLFDLLKESFRQRPDYVIVGEIRGKEAFVLFQGASSGHPSFSTMHAEDINTMIKRLETEPINLSPSLIESLDIVCIMIQTKVQGQVVRRIREINEIIGIENEKAKINTPFIRDPRYDKFFHKRGSYIFDKIVKSHGIPIEKLNQEFIRRAKLLMYMYQNGIYGFKEVQDIINDYYKNPDALLRKFKII